MEAKHSMIQKLPFDTVKEILKYVPDRWNASMVCALFYEVVAEIERNMFVLNLEYFSTMNKKVRNLILSSSPEKFFFF